MRFSPFSVFSQIKFVLVFVFKHVRVGIDFVDQAVPVCDYDLVHLKTLATSQ